MIDFLKKAFSENGQPSSSRVISGIVTLWSMAMIGFCLRHMFYLEYNARLQTWVGGIPLIIGALTGLSASNYGVGKLAGMFKKDAPIPPAVDDHQNTTVIVDDSQKG